MKKVMLVALAACLAICFCVYPCHASSINNYDVDGDGKVTINDATAIQKYLAGYGENNVQIELDDIASYLPTEIEFVPYLLSEEVSEGEGYAIVDSSMLTAEILEHRTEHDVLIIERVVGYVTDRNGNGKVLNTNGDFNYINYKYVREPITTGTVVLTYLIYNPNNNYVDDIVNRFDFVIDRTFEV